MNDATLLEETIIPVTVTYLEEDQLYQISCPWLQGCHAWSETLDEAMHTIPGNIRAIIEAYREKGTPLPTELENLNLQNPFTLRVVPA